MEDNLSLLERLMEVRRQVRLQQPLIHMIPNQVTAALCADGLAALGARPFMAVAPEEMEEASAQSAVSVVNLGQPTAEKFRAAEILLASAAQSGKRIVLDPVGCGASAFRLNQTQKLLSIPWKGVLKGNRGEIFSLQSGSLTQQGIDSIGEYALSSAAPAGRLLAVTGKTDRILSAHREITLTHSPLHHHLVGMGCLLGAITGAFCAVEPELETAVLAAFCFFAWAQQKADAADGYGAFKSRLLDAFSGDEDEEFRAFLSSLEKELTYESLSISDY
jgi:hydroxyethylthiazole kinase